MVKLPWAADGACMYIGSMLQISGSLDLVFVELCVAAGVESSLNSAGMQRVVPQYSRGDQVGQDGWTERIAD